uniref:Uncharacterized protein n=1 Tax=Daucus carota subsp. sativus TaxID=79200 RepID=A0A161ZRS1_DAUCS
MANQHHHHNITNGGGVHDGVFLCFDCNNRPFRSHMDLLRHRLNDHQHQHVAAQAPAPPPPPVNNGMPGDESTDDELIIILDPPPALGEPVAAVPPQGLPQNGPIVDGHAVNEPPKCSRQGRTVMLLMIVLQTMHMID